MQISSEPRNLIFRRYLFAKIAQALQGFSLVGFFVVYLFRNLKRLYKTNGHTQNRKIRFLILRWRFSCITPHESNPRLAKL